MKIRKCSVAVFIGLLVGSAAVANAETKKFNSPRSNGYMLDWCLKWGKSESPNRCGKPVADSYCKTVGFTRSISYKKWEDPGKPTRQIASGSVCDAKFCDSFKSIVCEK